MGPGSKLAALLSPPASAAMQSNEYTLTQANGDINELYGQVWQVDAEPTMQQSEAAVVAGRNASAVMKRWEGLKESDLPALNQALHNANLTPVQIERDPHNEESNIDEE